MCEGVKQRLRLITTADDITHRELLALNEEEFTLEKMEEYIKEIIKQNEYNLENYNLLLQKNSKLEEENYKLQETNEEKDKKISDLAKKLENYQGKNPNDITTVSRDKISSNYAVCKYGYFLYAFQCENMRFVCSIARQKDFDNIHTNLKQLYPAGELKCKELVKYPFSEKNMMFLLKQNMTLLGNNKFEGSFENIKTIIDIAIEVEKLFIDKSSDLFSLLSIVKNEHIENKVIAIDPETSFIKKAKRSIDQINKETGEIINTYDSIEAAGRALGLTTGTAVGIALREKRACKGFLWRYTGISKEEQFNKQPVIKVCCSTAEKIAFVSIADAARDAKISAPALRQRIITQVHLGDYHWVFDKKSTHYTF